MDLLCSLCSAAHFPPKSHLKLFQFRTRDARRRSKCLLKEMYIPDELLKHDLDGKPSVDIPSYPVLVFVDIKDEKLGGQLYNEFCYRLNKKTGLCCAGISDSKRPIKIEDPEGVLKEVYGTPRKSEKYEFADDIHKRMRIIIVGGDDVVNRILGVICDLKLPELPSIVPISHGTENNIPLSFGWVGHLLVYESIFQGINYFSSFVVD